MTRRTKIIVGTAGTGTLLVTALALPAIGAPSFAGAGATLESQVGSVAAVSAAAADGQPDLVGGPPGGRPGGGGLFGLAGAADSSQQKVLESLGITESEVKAGRQAGKSLTEIAAGQGVSKAKLLSALQDAAVKAVPTLVDAKVTAKDDGAAKGDGAEKPERANPLDSALAELVKNGTLTQAQADAVKKQVQQEGRQGAKDRIGKRASGDAPTEVTQLATYLKTTPEQLMTKLRAGQSLTEIAQAQGISRASLITKVSELVKSAVASRIDATPPARGDARPERSPGQSESGSESGSSSSSSSSSAGGGSDV